MTNPTPADTLRAAADRLTQPGTRILVTPHLIQPLTDWLYSAAEDAETIGPDPYAVATARAILAEQAPQEPASTPEVRAERYRIAWHSARRRADCRTLDADVHSARHNARRAWDEYELLKQRAATAETALARVRAVRDKWLRNTLELGQVRRLLDDLTDALDATTPGERSSHPDPGECEHEAALARAAAAIDHVRALHYPIAGPDTHTWCVTCGGDYPCATIRALDRHTQEH